MLFSKRKLKMFKLCLVSPTLEQLLLISYLVLFPVSIYISTNQTSYNSPQMFNLDTYNARQNVKQYFMPNATSGFVFEGYSKDYDWVYDYLNQMLHERLWVADSYRPYMAVGSVRMV